MAALVTAAAMAAVVTEAALLAARPRPRLPRTGGTRGARPRRRIAGTVAAAGLTAVLARGSLPGVVLPLIGLAVGAAVVRAIAERGRRRTAAQVRRRVVDLCDGLGAELAAGQTPAGALERAAAEWPLVAPAARAALTGGDVVLALRTLAATPGADALRLVAAAWQVAHRTGHGLADTLDRVAADLRAAERTRRVVAGELASARATARLLAGLPVLALAMAAGAGADPLRFLVGHPAGLACLVGGLASGYAGLAWIEALARGVERHG